MTRGRFSNIVIGVIGVIYNSKNEVLFVKQHHGPYGGNWIIPGGRIEFGEDGFTAIKREVLEETGILIENPSYMGLYEMLGEWREGGFHLLMATFKCKCDKLIPIDFVGHNVDGITWAKPENIDYHSSDKMILTDAGITKYTNKEINDALKKDNVKMRLYTTIRK